MYVMTGGAVAPPRVLKASLRSRTSRAAMRTFGLQALAALLRILSPEEQVAMSVGASSAVQVSYMLRALFCRVTVVLLHLPYISTGVKRGPARLWCTLVCD